MSTIAFPSKEEIEKINLFFIIGRPRSGTTLLRTLMDAHANVIVPTESPFILLLARKYKNITLWTEEIIKQFVNDIQVIWLYKTLKLDIDNLQKNLLSLQGQTDYLTICKAVMLQFNNVFPKNQILFVGDKNPRYSVMFNDLFRLTGTKCKYIHLIRDYRDLHFSIMQQPFEFPYPATTTSRWKKSYQDIIKIRVKYPEIFHSLTYEEMVTSPEKEIEKICLFLGIRYNPDILNFHLKKDDIENIFPETAIKNVHKSLLNPIKPDKIGLYKNGITSRQIKICDFVAGKTAEKAGYIREYRSFNPIVFCMAFPGIFIFYCVVLITRFAEILNFKLYIKIMGRPLLSTLWNKYILRRKFN
jgi:hypothetical protein